MVTLMVTPLDLDQLQTFCVIADCGSFTEAARRVHKTQPAVSVQIKRLEERLGGALFVRDRAGMQLTPKGALIYVRAQHMLRLNAEIVDLVNSAGSQFRVRFGLPNDYALGLLPQILRSLQQGYPQLSVETHCRTSSDLVGLLNEGQLDVIAFTQGIDNHYGVPLRTEPLAWVGKSGGQAHKQDPLPIACSSPQCPWYQDAAQQLKQAGRESRVAYVSGDVVALISVVMSDLAVGFLPESAVQAGMDVIPSPQVLPRLSNAQLALLRGAHASGAIFDGIVRTTVESIGNLSPAGAESA